MRIYNTLSISYSVTRDVGYWLSKRQSALIANRFGKILELTQYQKGIVQEFLRGSPVDHVLDSKFSPKESEAVKGFMTWYAAEYVFPKGRRNTVAYVVANLNTGSICVFTHGGWKHEGASISENGVTPLTPVFVV